MTRLLLMTALLLAASGAAAQDDATRTLTILEAMPAAEEPVWLLVFVGVHRMAIAPVPLTKTACRAALEGAASALAFDAGIATKPGPAGNCLDTRTGTYLLPTAG
jgi:hypothetical protein